MTCLLGGVLLTTDAVQERLLRIAGRVFYGAEVFVHAPSFIGEFRAERIEIFDPYSDRSQPTVRIDDVAVAYSLAPGGSGLVQAVRAKRIGLRADFTDSASSNAQWLRELWDVLSEDTESVPPPKVEIETIVVAFYGASASAELEWAGLRVEPMASGGWRLDIEPERLVGWLRLENLNDPIRIRDAVVKIHVEQVNSGLRGDFFVDVPQFFRIEGGLGETEVRDSRNVDDGVVVRIDSFMFSGEQWAVTQSASDEFDSVHVTQGNFLFTEKDSSGMTFDFVLDSGSYRGVELNDVALSGTAYWSSDAGVLGLEELVVAAADGVNRVTMSDWEIDFDPPHAQGAFEAAVDLATVGAALQEEALWGEAQIRGTVDLDEDRILVPFTIVSDVVGYGDWMTPYRMPLTGEGRVEYGLSDSRGVLNEVEFRLGPGTRLRFPEWSFGTSAPETSGRVEFVSDLDAVVAMGLLDSAGGSIEASWAFAYRDETLSGPWTLEVDVDELVLTEQVASLSGLTGIVSGTWTVGLQGSGELRVESMSVAGGEARDISGDITIDDSVLRMPNVTAGLFDGRLTADVALGLADEGFPVTLDAELYEMDFERFTQEVQPPSLKLTGRANGQIDLEYTLAGLQRFLLRITSDEGLSVNRGLIEEALRTDTLRETLGERRLRKTMDTLLGKEPQRPFDSGELTVRLEAEQFVSTVRLESVKTRDYNGLNLNVELVIDLPALVATLKLLEQSSGGAVDF